MRTEGTEWPGPFGHDCRRSRAYALRSGPCLYLGYDRNLSEGEAAVNASGVTRFYGEP